MPQRRARAQRGAGGLTQPRQTFHVGKGEPEETERDPTMVMEEAPEPAEK